MRMAIILAAALTASAPSFAQQLQAPGPQGPIVGPKIGQYEVKAYQTIPRAKMAVQLSSDTALGRNLRREVMVRIARRGNEVGFSGGNVMRMDVTYFDLNGSGSRPDGSGPTTIPGMGNQFDGPGGNPRPDVPGYRFERRNNSATPSSSASLRLVLTLYSIDGGKVLWAATANCSVFGDAETAGVAMIDAIFENANKSQIGDANCPL